MGVALVQSVDAEVVVPLTADETMALSFYEKVIRAGKMSMGMALDGIKEGRLYRGTHGTFEAYCKEMFKMSPRHVNRKILAASTVKALGPIGSQTLSERVVRPVTKLVNPDGTPDTEKQRNAMKEASKKAAAAKRRVTAKDTQEAVDRINGIINGEEKPHEGLERGSQANYYASIAVHHLERISDKDPKRHEAGVLVIKWCKKHLLTKKEG